MAAIRSIQIGAIMNQLDKQLEVNYDKIEC